MDQQYRLAAFPLSPGQTGIWASHHAGKLSTACQASQTTEIFAAIDRTVFRAAARAVVATKETLCLRFIVSPNGPLQWTDASTADGPVVTFHDLSCDPESAVASKHLVQAITERPIVPTADQPLFKWHLIKLTSNRFILLQIYHHLIADATTRTRLLARMSAAYAAQLEAGGERGPATPSLAVILSDSDYRQGRRAWLEDQAYWLSQLADMPTMPSLSGSNPPALGWSSHRQTRFLTKAVHETLRDIARRFATTLPALLAACVGLYFGRVCDKRDILLGWMTSGRLGRVSRAVPAMLANRVVLRLRIDPSQSVAGLLDAGRRQTRMALRH